MLTLIGESGAELQDKLFGREEQRMWVAAQVLRPVLSLAVCTYLHPQFVDSTCTTLRLQEEVNGRLCSCRDGSVGVWS